MIALGLEHLQTIVDPIPKLKTVRTKFIHLWKENSKTMYNLPSFCDVPVLMSSLQVQKTWPFLVSLGALQYGGGYCGR